jgi:hypothetical protein
MTNAGLKRASISATLVFADLRQVTNGIAEAHQCSILADDVQQDRCFLLSSYESTSLAHPIARSTLRTLTWKNTGRQPRRSVARSPGPLASRRCSFRRSPIFPSSTLATRGGLSATVAGCSSALAWTTTTNDAPKTSCKNSERLLAASHGV